MDKNKANIPQKLKDLWPLIYAYLNGERVQCKYISTWKDINSISDFHAFNNEFRIYNEPKLVPFTFEDRQFFKNLWFKVKASGALIRPLRIDRDGLYFSNKALDFICYSHLLSGFELEDGSPCGKYIEE